MLLLTGVYLTLFFDPSMAEVTYNGVYQPLNGVQMSRAYETALDLGEQGADRGEPRLGNGGHGRAEGVPAE